MIQTTSKPVRVEDDRWTINCKFVLNSACDGVHFLPNEYLNTVFPFFRMELSKNDSTYCHVD